jgi:hypothetical protein
LLVSWCAGGRCGMVGSDEDRGRSRRPGAKDREWSHMSGTRWPNDRRSGDVVCGLHRARGDEEHIFLGSVSKPWSTVCQRFYLKTTRMGLSVVWPQNHWDGFLLFGLKTTETVFSCLASKSVAAVFSGLTSKPVATVSPSLASKPVVGFLVEPQNQTDGIFPSLGLKTSGYGLVI